MVDARALSYIQLRRLYAALAHALDDVERETRVRSEAPSAGDTTVSVRPDVERSDG